MPAHPTANDRFKEGFGSAFWVGLIAATAIHALVLLASPTFVLAGATGPADPPLVVMPAEPPLPEPPSPLPRPVAPRFTDVAPPDVTIPVNVPSDGEWDRLDPPRPEATSSETGAREFTVFDTRPVLRNPEEVQAALRRQYPAALREAGIGGTVDVWFHLDERGRVLETELDRSSGFDAFDEAALRVAEVMRFSPARNRDRPVPVWVSLEIRFEVQ